VVRDIDGEADNGWTWGGKEWRWARVTAYHDSEGGGAWRGKVRYALLIGTERLGVHGSREAELGVYGSQKVGLGNAVQGSC
jgi:hypothetical protein